MDKKRFMRDQVIADILCNGDPEQEIALLHELIDVELTKTDQEMDCDFISACVRQIHELEGRELEVGITPEPRLFAKRAQKKSLRKKIVRAAVVFLSFCVGLFALNGISVTALNVNIIDGLYQWTNRGIFFHSGASVPTIENAPVISVDTFLQRLKDVDFQYVWLPIDMLQEAGGVTNLEINEAKDSVTVNFEAKDQESGKSLKFSIYEVRVTAFEGQSVRSGGILGEFDRTDKIRLDGLSLYLFGGKSGVRCIYEEETPDRCTSYLVGNVYEDVDFDFNIFKEIMSKCNKVVISE